MNQELNSFSKNLSASYEHYAQISKDADTIYFNNPENLYIYDGTIISGTSLFLDMSLRGCGKKALMCVGGTGVYSSAFYEKINRFGYEEFYSANLLDDNVYYITTNTNIEDSAFMTYMKKCYGESVSYEMVDTTESGVIVYKLYRRLTIL